MASTYSTDLRLEKQTQGENQDTWGDRLNDNTIEMLEDAICSETSISTTGGTTTLTTNNGSADQARNVFLDIGGTLVSNAEIEIPAVNKFYLVRNGTSGAFTVTVLVNGQTGQEVSQGASAVLYCDGTNTFSIGAEDTNISAFGATLVDDADAATARTTLGLGDVSTLSINSTGGLEDSSGLRIKIPTNSGFTRDANGLAFNVNDLAAETGIQTGDSVPIYDTSGGTSDKITVANFMKVINEFTTITTVDENNDFVAIYDATDSSVKKVAPTNLVAASGAGGWTFLDSKTTSGATITFEDDTDFDFDLYNALKFRLINVAPSANDTLRVEVKLATSGWTNTDGPINCIRYMVGGTNLAGTDFGLATANNTDQATLTAQGINNSLADGFTGTLDLFGVNDQATDSMTAVFQGTFRNSSSNHSGSNGSFMVNDQSTTEDIVGIRFYWASGANFNSSSKIMVHGQGYASS